MIYFLLGIIWIFLSNAVVLRYISDPAVQTTLQSYKGVVFVFVTSILLYFLIRRDYHNVNRSRDAIRESYDDTLLGWSAALDLRDHDTEGHTLRVTEMTVKLAHLMGIPKEDLEHIRRGALMHDIGKMGVPDNILNKPGKLTDHEWMIISQHPIHAYNFLSRIDFLRPALDIPYCHHEKWEGSGYPRGLKGEDIPLPARIFAVVDVWDALSSDRPYRDAWPEDKVIEHLRFERGKYFQPEIVDLFLELLEQERKNQSATAP